MGANMREQINVTFSFMVFFVNHLIACKFPYIGLSIFLFLYTVTCLAAAKKGEEN